MGGLPNAVDQIVVTDRSVANQLPIIFHDIPNYLVDCVTNTTGIRNSTRSDGVKGSGKDGSLP